MIIVPDAEIAGLMDAEASFEAVEARCSPRWRAATPYNFPVVREAIGHAEALYGFKSGFDKAGMVLGLKSGGYWPGNAGPGPDQPPVDGVPVRSRYRAAARPWSPATT